MPAISKLKGKKILLRLDLNVPLAGAKIADDYKIKAALGTVSLFSKNPLIIITHLGEPSPRGEYEYLKAYSLAPVARRLAQLSRRTVRLVSGTWTEITASAQAAQAGDIIMVENLRFWKGETSNALAFAKSLATLGDIYVNDAFAVSHRRHASVAALKRYLPAYAGPGLTREYRKLKAVALGKRPVVVIMGGAKIASKLPLIKKFLPRAESILLGGALANDVLEARGFSIGDSFHDDSALEPRVRSSAKIIIPSDLVIKSKAKQPRVVGAGAVGPHDTIIDIGPETARAYAARIAAARTIVWNGPLGKFEDLAGREGTRAIVMALDRAAQRGACVAAGGGETVEAIGLFKRRSSIEWELAGGGASLAFLAGDTMPGLEGLVR